MRPAELSTTNNGGVASAASLPSPALADLAAALDAAGRALRDLEAVAAAVPGSLAEGFRAWAERAAAGADERAYDLFLAAGGFAGEAGR